MDDLIYTQHDSPADQWRYGFRTSAATGCGWIATYNALRLLGYRVDIEELITWYERTLPLIHGNAGTAFPAPALRFMTWGFPVSIVLDQKKFDEAAKEADVCLLFYRWRKGYRLWAPISWRSIIPKLASSATTPTKIPRAPTVTVPALWIS